MANLQLFKDRKGVKRVLLRLSLALLFISVSGIFISINQYDSRHKVASHVSIIQYQLPSKPKRLIIPAISLNANIQQVGVALTGEMESPDNAYDVAWYSLGSIPGQKGSAVIAGHLDTEDGEEGVFANIDILEVGDRITIEDENGLLVNFKVLGSRTYKPGTADEVFNLNDTAHLNLVTCKGVWNSTEKSYSKRLVVFSEIEQ